MPQNKINPLVYWHGCACASLSEYACFAITFKQVSSRFGPIKSVLLEIMEFFNHGYVFMRLPFLFRISDIVSALISFLNEMHLN